jgi:hypothetical protein
MRDKTKAIIEIIWGSIHIIIALLLIIYGSQTLFNRVLIGIDTILGIYFLALGITTAATQED